MRGSTGCQGASSSLGIPDALMPQLCARSIAAERTSAYHMLSEADKAQLSCQEPPKRTRTAHKTVCTPFDCAPDYTSFALSLMTLGERSYARWQGWMSHRGWLERVGQWLCSEPCLGFGLVQVMRGQPFGVVGGGEGSGVRLSGAGRQRRRQWDEMEWWGESVEKAVK